MSETMFGDSVAHEKRLDPLQHHNYVITIRRGGYRLGIKRRSGLLISPLRKAWKS